MVGQSLSQILPTFVALLGGLGIGSVLTTFVKDRFERKQFRYREKLNVYSGYVEALQNSVVEASEVNRQKVVYWHQRLKLVSSIQIDEMAKRFYEKSSKENFTSYRDDIVREMRKDLDKSL